MPSRKEAISLPTTDADVIEIRKLIRLIARGKQKYQTNIEIGRSYGVSGTRIGQIYESLPASVRRKKKAAKWRSLKPKRRARDQVSAKTKRILALVRQRLATEEYPSAAAIAYRRRMTAHDVTTACQRYLTPEEKLAMARLQPVGRRKDVVKESTSSP